MSTDAVLSQGTVLEISDDASPEVWTPIPQLTNIAKNDGEAADIQVSDLDSTAHEYKQGIPDSGTVTADMMYIPQDTVHDGLDTAAAAGTRKHLRIVFADSPQTSFTFFGYIKSLPATTALDEVVRGTLTIKVDGAYTKSP